MTISRFHRGDRRARRLRASLGAIGVALTLATAAHAAPSDAGERLAYVDPGIGSFVLQTLLAIAAGVAVTVRSYRNRIRSFFGGSSDTPAAKTPPAPVATREDE